MKVGICMVCGAEVERGQVDIRTLGDPYPAYVDGQWEQHEHGGPYAERHAYRPPLIWVRSHRGRARWGEFVYCGPPATVPVPTPDDLLRGAGLSVGLL